MGARLIGHPRSGGHFGNKCAFCHYFEGDAQLERYKIKEITYDDVKGRCLEISNSGVSASRAACNRFVMSNNASRYCKS